MSIRQHFSLSHLSDRPDYRPPAGATAVHLRHDRSPHSYGYDRYYFAHSSQLYMIVIGSAGDKEDRELYRHFLESIQIDGWRMKTIAAPGHT